MDGERDAFSAGLVQVDEPGDHEFVVAGELFRIRRYREGDRGKVLDLWKAAFRQPISESLWRWKYDTNPFGHRILLCLNEEDRVVAAYGGIPYRATCRGRTLPLCHIMDSMSHPRYRWGFIFPRTVTSFFRRFGGVHDLPYLYGLPGERHYRLGRKILRYRRLTNVLVYFIGEVPQRRHYGFKWWRGRLERLEEGDCQRIDILWKRCCPFYTFAIRRDGTYVKWRYFQHPEKNYEVWGYRGLLSRDLKAYGVVARDGESSSLVDLLVLPEQDVLRDFLNRLQFQMALGGAKILQTWLCRNFLLLNVLPWSGFSHQPEPMGVVPVAMTFDPSLTFEWADRNLYYTMADGDLF